MNIVRLLLALLMLHAAEARALCTVICSCGVVATPVAFGAVNPLSASPADSTGTIKVSCGGIAGLLIPYRVDLNAGVGGTLANRKMSAGANRLNYNLYLDSNRLQVWGDGSGSTQPVNGSFGLDVLGLSPAQTLVVYGRIPGFQNLTVPGLYADTIGVTLTYY